VVSNPYAAVEEKRAVVHELGTLCVQRTIDTVGNPRG
jgi:hypothetical protein